MTFPSLLLASSFGGPAFPRKANVEAWSGPVFQDQTPIHPHQRFHLHTDASDLEMRAMDWVTPIGKGQRGLIVAPPRTGKTILLQKIVQGVLRNHPECRIFVVLIDERPEEVTDMRIKLESERCEIVASTFDRDPQQHRRTAESVIQRAKQIAERGGDVVILLDSITRLARACNALAPANAKILTGGIAAGSLDWPKRLFGTARQLEDGGSLTILATALIDTESRMDEVIFQEFKGTGNMELHLSRRLAEKRIWPAIDLHASGTRREELLRGVEECRTASLVRRSLADLPPAEAMTQLLRQLRRFASKDDFIRSLIA